MDAFCKRLSKLGGVVRVCIIFGLLAQGTLGQSRPHLASDADAQRFIAWLPPDTETLFVARGPFKVESARGLGSRSHLTKDLQLFTFGYIFATVFEVPFGGEGDPFQPLLGHEVQLAIYGSRNFRAPSSLGIMPSEGCQIIWFAGNADSMNDLEKKVAERAHRTMEIGGHQVFVFETRLEEDDWIFYVARPNPHIFVAATSEGYLREVLERMEKVLPVRAFPPNLPEWKHVNREAQFWAIRHFHRSGASNDPSSPYGGRRAANEPDEEAIGVTFSYDPSEGNKARIIYLSQNEDALDVARRMWHHPSDGLTPRFRKAGPNGVEVEAAFPSDDAEGMFVFVMLAVFGHGIYV